MSPGPGAIVAPMFSGLGDLLLEHLGTILAGVMTVLMGVLVALARRVIRQVPAVLHRLALELEAKADETDTPLDDMVAVMVKAAAESLRNALEAEDLPPPKVRR